MRQASDLVKSERRWTAAVFREPRLASANGRFAVGVLPGEGVGPEVLSAALAVLSAVEIAGARFEVSTGGPIGRDAEVLTGKALTEEVERFCEGVFEDGGAVLAGPGGGRFVYDLRRRFDLFCKLSPLRPFEALHEAGRLKARERRGRRHPHRPRELGRRIPRANGARRHDAERGRVCRHAFHYSEDAGPPAPRSRRASSRHRAAAGSRSSIKDGGLPTVSALWRDVGREAAAALRRGAASSRHRPDGVPARPGAAEPST